MRSIVRGSRWMPGSACGGPSMTNKFWSFIMTSNNDFLPFAKPDLSEDAIAEVVACLRSGWITTGPRVQKFEEMLSAYHGGRRALCVSSATAGLHVALLALNLKE